ncbi:thyroid receptor-interacting protein 6 isoform X1 [Stigmatopora nigra]
MLREAVPSNEASGSEAKNASMSGPTWLPPRTLDSPERAVPQMSHQPASAVYGAPFRPKYGPHEQNGGGIATRYVASGPSGGPARYYSPPHGPQEDRRWSGQEMSRLGSDKTIDADIDSLSAMLADLDGHPQDSGAQLYDNVPYNKYISGDRYQAVRNSPGYPPQPHGRGAPSYPGEHVAPQRRDYYSTAPPSKPYPQPVPASYTTASTPTGPRFSVQVKSAQPVTYSQTGRQAEQAYTPQPPRPPPQAAPQDWYPGHPGSQELQRGRGAQVTLSKRGMENNHSGAAPGPAYQSGKYMAAAPSRPEEELERLTKKLVYDMNHPPAEDYFGRCARCGDNVVGDGSGCVAMEQVFHVECFTCITCHARLRGQPFYALDKKSYCETCYISTLEQCSKCSKPILDRILRAMGKAYHPRCFTCVVCNCCLDGVPFTVDATSQIHCIEDFHRKYAPRCSVCGEPIMPEAGQEETVRIVALDRSFHVNCYTCEECGLLLSSEGEGRGCYPLDGHILCKGCSARRIQDLSAKISTDC